MKTIENMKKIAFVLAMGMMLWGCGTSGEETDGTSDNPREETSNNPGEETSGKKSETPITEEIVDNFDSESSAKLVFDEEMHDFGNLSAGEQVSYSFHFRNVGKKDLIISGCSASCGCTVASYPQGRIAPGEDGYLAVSFNSSGKAGETYEEVTVVSNAQPGRQILKIHAKVGF